MSTFPAGGQLDPRAFIQSYRANYVNLYMLWRQGAAAPPGVRVHTPAERPLRVEELPEDLRRIASEIAGPGRSIELMKYLRTEDGRPSELVEDERGLPDEQCLVTLSRTISVVEAERVRIVTEVYAGQLSEGLGRVS